MKFDLPVVNRELDLAGYEPEYAGAVIEVWVNPPRQHVKRYEEHLIRTAELIRELQELSDNSPEAAAALAEIEQIGSQIVAWMAETWSQGSQPWTVAEVQQLVEHSRDRDPMLWQWITAQTLVLIRDYRTDQKKAWRRRSSGPGEPA